MTSLRFYAVFSFDSGSSSLFCPDLLESLLHTPARVRALGTKGGTAVGSHQVSHSGSPRTWQGCIFQVPELGYGRDLLVP